LALPVVPFAQPFQGTSGLPIESVKTKESSHGPYAIDEIPFQSIPE
jgi:hypothetical protein